MAKPTPHAALSDLGFKLVESNTEPSQRLGDVTVHHYTLNRGTLGNGGIVRPITHHVHVEEYGKNPGKYNVFYSLAQRGRAFEQGDYDMVKRHNDNASVNGSEDPIRDIMKHHLGVSGSLDRMKSPPLVDESNRLIPGPYRATEGWGADDPGMKKPRYIVPSRTHTGDPFIHLNSFEGLSEPLDPDVHQALTQWGKGGTGFTYMGRVDPDDEEGDRTDYYHTSMVDPEDPYMRYGFSVRHMPSAAPLGDPEVGTEVTRGVEIPPIAVPRARTFSYNVTHYPAGSDGESPVGEFQDVTGLGEPVANFSSVGPLLERHLNVMRSLGLAPLPPRPPRPTYSASLLSKLADEFDDIISGAGSAGPCWSCGKATYNYPEGTSTQRDSSVPINASEETGGDMHGPDINLCGDCANDYDNHHMAVTYGSRGPGRIWHYNDQGVRDCPECDAHLMDQADEDLRP